MHSNFFMHSFYHSKSFSELLFKYLTFKGFSLYLFFFVLASFKLIYKTYIN